MSSTRWTKRCDFKAMTPSFRASFRALAGSCGLQVFAVAPAPAPLWGRAGRGLRGYSTIDPVTRTPATVCLLIVTRSRQIEESRDSTQVPEGRPAHRWLDL